MPVLETAAIALAKTTVVHAAKASTATKVATATTAAAAAVKAKAALAVENAEWARLVAVADATKNYSIHAQTSLYGLPGPGTFGMTPHDAFLKVVTSNPPI
jgi:hypothetical protein